MIFPFKLNISKYLLRQILLASVGLVEGSCAGAVFAFTSILFAQLKHDHSIVMSESDESWLASIPTILMIPTCLLSGLVIEKLGRKITIIASELLALTSWILTYFAEDYTMLVCARIVFGAFLGVVYPTLITFLGEISMPKYRTLFLTVIAIGSTVGAFLCQFMGEYISWRTVAAIFAILPVYDLCICFYIRESYVTYMDCNKMDEARLAYEWFRGDSPEAKTEFDEIVEERKRKSKDSLLDLYHMCSNKSFLVPLGITTLVFLTNEFTATQAMLFYTSQIIAMIKDDPDFSYYAILALNLLRIVAVILSMMLVKISSVRFILISSGYLLGICLLILALFLYLSRSYVNNTAFPILALCALILNTILYSIGLGPLPSVVCGEMFPQATRSIGGAISAAMSFVFLFIVVKFMPSMFISIGSYWTFCIFGVITLVGITASHLVLPYTKNKTLQEINKMYQDQEIIEAKN